MSQLFIMKIEYIYYLLTKGIIINDALSLWFINVFKGMYSLNSDAYRRDNFGIFTILFLLSLLNMFTWCVLEQNK